MSNKYKLSKINLNNNPLKDAGLRSIAQGLIDNDTLRVITLQNVGISQNCIPDLANCLQNKKFLTKLLLDGNIIGPLPIMVCSLSKKIYLEKNKNKIKNNISKKNLVKGLPDQFNSF